MAAARDRLEPSLGFPLSDAPDQLRAEYFRGLSRPRPSALIADLLRLKSNLLRLDADAKRRSHE